MASHMQTQPTTPARELTTTEIALGVGYDPHAPVPLPALPAAPRAPQPGSPPATSSSGLAALFSWGASSSSTAPTAKAVQPPPKPASAATTATATPVVTPRQPPTGKPPSGAQQQPGKHVHAHMSLQQQIAQSPLPRAPPPVRHSAHSTPTSATKLTPQQLQQQQQQQLAAAGQQPPQPSMAALGRGPMGMGPHTATGAAAQNPGQAARPGSAAGAAAAGGAAAGAGGANLWEGLAQYVNPTHLVTVRARAAACLPDAPGSLRSAVDREYADLAPPGVHEHASLPRFLSFPFSFPFPFPFQAISQMASLSKDASKDKSPIPLLNDFIEIGPQAEATLAARR